MKLLKIRSGDESAIIQNFNELVAGIHIDEPVTEAILRSYTCHGSPIPPHEMGDVLIPHQARTGTANRGEVDHGEMAISVSANAYLPIARSLIHERGKALANSKIKTYPYMGVFPNAHAERFIFTNTDVYHALRKANSVGYLYGIQQLPSDAYLFEPHRYKGRHHEIRIPRETSWDWVAEVEMSDLPHDIYVAPSTKDRRAFFAAFRETYDGHPLQLAEEMGIQIMLLQNYIEHYDKTIATP